MAAKSTEALNAKSSKIIELYGWDLLLGTIAAFYVFMVPYTKVEESFNVQAMHDVIYLRHHLEKYDHLDFPGVVPRTFIVRLVLGFIILSTLRFFRIEVRRKFGHQVEAFFVILTAIQFHLLFYCTRPLPNILALGLVNLGYAFWFKGSFLAALRCLTLATIVFRCDTLLLLGPLGLELLLTKSVSLWEAFKCCVSSALIGVGFSVLVDTIMWRRILWPELEVFWFNSVLNRSSEWGTHAFHWYFTSALPRSLLSAYPLCVLGVFVDRRSLLYILPVFSFVLLYSKLPHKELRFIIGSIPMFNLSAAIAASRIYNNRKKKAWEWIYFIMIGSFVVSLGCTVITFMASYENYPGGYALKALHQIGHSNNTTYQWVHIDSFAAMNGISRFCENDFPWRYSKEEGIAIEEFQYRNFTYLLNEHSSIDGFKCLFAVNGFSKIYLQMRFPLIVLLKEPKVFVHGNLRNQDVAKSQWAGCP
ncbi:dol-P-Man:Man(7)GlcNAc(2)-PP-Dol alpha-1,6-mannosyltransferase isoform X2 [Magnolia sinica]|uniref:dol-P-Man:Man(7)GlcNAc(2)-PP-Dol alpha-1,6-mannosyltransferase isoform X2 n=1 Tax=Magnolia sinica TaxID=86752 RepID=UPI00265A75C9|nr:dol-P-Man:Man(7)GlcNAc(2)-PP-Dol alpha-1,6-mannosyltransferase isoform X2 [Magnolia sinica]